jgi:hypothetical protein
VPKDFIDEFDLDVDGPEANATVEIDITRDKATKIQGLRNYKSQEDAQEVATMMEAEQWGSLEMFHQVYPPATKGVMSTGFWD